jgi:hypothetical protein
MWFSVMNNKPNKQFSMMQAFLSKNFVPNSENTHNQSQRIFSVRRIFVLSRLIVSIFDFQFIGAKM